MDRYFSLLKSWCDKLIDFQITERTHPAFYGGILCPACVSMHGRIADAVYPFVYLYDKTGEDKYLQAAKRALIWSENNVFRKSGAVFNEKKQDWRGISVFTAIALGDTLYYHASCLDDETRHAITARFKRIVDYIRVFFVSPKFHANVNYPVSLCAALALAYKIFGDEAYKTEAYAAYDRVKGFFTPEGLLHGEGPRTPTAHKGCYYVDLGYNVEESLTSIAVFGHHMEDEDVLKKAADAYKAHIAFMLPDGAWDNSFGTRENKWTYWGSRTSDGAGEGLCYLTAYGDELTEACERNFELLERCTKDGALYGGVSYIDMDEEACVHHAFCHAKALAAMLDSGFAPKKRVKLPREEAYGIKYYPSLHVNLIAKGVWRATVSDTDAVCYRGAAVSGGTVSALWTEKTGMLAAAEQAQFLQTEPTNMQLSRHDDEVWNTAIRITRGDDESVNDLKAVVETAENAEGITVSAKGVLRDVDFRGETPYTLTYRFGDDAFTVTAACEKDAVLWLPLFATWDEPVEVTADGALIRKKNAVVEIKPKGCTLVMPEDLAARRFHVVGGFASVPMKVELKAGMAAEVTVTVR